MLLIDMRGRTKEIHKDLQDLDPLCSPHLQERCIGGNIDLDLLSPFPQRYARIMGGIERGASFPRSTMVGERERGKIEPPSLWRRKGAFYSPSPTKSDCYNHLHQLKPTKPDISKQKSGLK
jgi:hypothetical protein